MRVERRGPSGYEYARSRNVRRRRSGPPKALVILIAVIAVIAVVAGVLVFSRYSYTKERMDLTEYLGTEDGSMAVFVDNVQITGLEHAPAIRSGGNIYLSLDFAEDALPNRFYYNSDGTLRYMYPTEIIRIAEGDTGWTVGGERTELYIPCFLVQDGEVYVSAEMMQVFTDISVTDYADPDRVFIETLDGREVRTATTKRGTQIRYRGGPKSPILMDVPAGTEVRVLSTGDAWGQVSWGGVVGYVPAKDLGEIVSAIPSVESRVPEFSNIALDTDVLLMFQQVYTPGNNANLEMIVESAPGMNVIAPTWYSLTDASGAFSSFSDPDYVQRAHALGVSVWGVVDDINGDISNEDLAAVLGNCRDRVVVERPDGLHGAHRYATTTSAPRVTWLPSAGCSTCLSGASSRTMATVMSMPRSAMRAASNSMTGWPARTRSPCLANALRPSPLSMTVSMPTWTRTCWPSSRCTTKACLVGGTSAMVPSHGAPTVSSAGTMATPSPSALLAKASSAISSSGMQRPVAAALSSIFFLNSPNMALLPAFGHEKRHGPPSRRAHA